ERNDLALLDVHVEGADGMHRRLAAAPVHLVDIATFERPHGHPAPVTPPAADATDLFEAPSRDRTTELLPARSGRRPGHWQRHAAPRAAAPEPTPSRPKAAGAITPSRLSEPPPQYG